MERTIRENVLPVTTVLTVVSLALVFGSVLGYVPVGALPRAPDAVLSAIPHVNAVVSLVAIGTILGAVRAIRNGDVDRHRRLMLTSLGLFATFLVLYLYKVAVAGTKAFPGPDVVYQFGYLPVLAIHMLLAVVCIPLLYYVALLGLTRPVADIYESNHRRVGRVAAALWLVSFALGEVVYALLYLVY